jgi:lipopolysaccharide transport system permease protein
MQLIQETVRLSVPSPEGQAPMATSQPETAPKRRITLIEPPRRWQAVNVAELWRFRDLAWQLAWRDIKVRYKQTMLGAGWAIFQPVMMMIVFVVFFHGVGQVSSGSLPYPLFVYAGLLPWMFFSAATTSAAQSVVGSERLITKIYFPRLAIPLAAVATAVVDAAISMCLLLCMMAWYRVPPTANLLALPLVFGAIALTATGLGTLLAALNVAYRDVRYVIPFLMQIWMFATPSIYTQTAALPPRVQWLVVFNPMVGLVASFRAAALGGPLPWAQLASALVIGVIALLAGCLYFRRIEDTFADTI